jgi:hypothetical protein
MLIFVQRRRRTRSRQNGLLKFGMWKRKDKRKEKETQLKAGRNVVNILKRKEK